MIANISIEESMQGFGHTHCTTTKEVVRVLRNFKITCSQSRLIRISKTNTIPPLGLLKIKWNSKGSHWVVVENGFIYDPAHGIYAYSEAEKAINGKITSFIPLQKD
jgi:hypothetical protein